MFQSFNDINQELSYFEPHEQHAEFVFATCVKYNIVYNSVYSFEIFMLSRIFDLILSNLEKQQ